jgi:hypothetical protein
VPFGFGGGDESGMPFTMRKDVDAGTDVIDLAAMRAELEATRPRPQGS